MTTILQWATVALLGTFAVCCFAAVIDESFKRYKAKGFVLAVLLTVVAVFQLAVAMGWVTR